MIQKPSRKKKNWDGGDQQLERTRGGSKKKASQREKTDEAKISYGRQRTLRKSESVDFPRFVTAREGRGRNSALKEEDF